MGILKSLEVHRLPKNSHVALSRIYWLKAYITCTDLLSCTLYGMRPPPKILPSILMFLVHFQALQHYLL